MTDRHTALRGSPAFDLVERPEVTGWDSWPEVRRPIARICSPIMEHREVRPLARDVEVVAVSLPPARDLVRPLAWAMLAAMPVLAVIGWQAALVAGGLSALIREVDRRVGRSDLSFAAGFLGFRGEMTWPRGVQEDDDVRWNWARSDEPGSAIG